MEIALFDSSGRRVKRLFEGAQQAGEHQLMLRPGGRLPSGVYLCKLRYDGEYERDIRLIID